MKKKFAVIILCLLMVFTFGACNLSASAADRPYSKDSKYQEPLEITSTITAGKIVETYVDACVTICIYDKNDSLYSLGSGVCIYKGGYIATNYHVASYAASKNYSLKVFLNGDIETPYDAALLWYNQQVDLAIIQCTNGDIPYVNMADRVYNTTNPLVPLEEVVAIGTPLEISLQNTYTLGYISGQNRASISDGNLYQDLIQHTAPINHGNSGGALFDMQGNLIALNTLGVDDANSLFFAVPIYPIMLVLNKVVDLNEQDPRTTFVMPRIGITAYDKTLASQVAAVDYSGDYVYVKDSENSLLKANDVIKSIKTAGGKTYTMKNRNQIVLALLDSNVNDVAEFTVIRDGSEIILNITLTA